MSTVEMLTTAGLPAGHAAAIEALLNASGHPDLWSWLELDKDANDDQLNERMRARRRWAQQHQANPRHKAQAVLILRHHRLYLETIQVYASEYAEGLKAIDKQEERRGFDLLVAGAAASGMLSTRAETLLRLKGRELGISDQDISWAIDQALFESGGARETTDEQQDHLIEIIGSVRGVAMQGLMRASTMRAIQRRATALGLSDDIFDQIVDAAVEQYPSNSRHLRGIKDEGRVARTTDPGPAPEPQRQRPAKPLAKPSADAFEDMIQDMWSELLDHPLDSALIRRLVDRWGGDGIPEVVVRHVLGQVAEQADAQRLRAQDPYRVLGVTPDATADELRAAFRSKYRWARNLSDKKRSSEELTRLDDALVRAKSPEVQMRYKALYAKANAPASPEALARSLHESWDADTAELCANSAAPPLIMMPKATWVS